MAPKEQATQLASFELVWSTVRDRNPDPKLNGLDWQAIHDSFEARVRRAKSVEEVRGILREMTGKLELSHYSIVPAEAYRGADAGARVAVPVQPTPTEPVRAVPQGKTVEFGNLPNMRVEFESRTLDGG